MQRKGLSTVPSVMICFFPPCFNTKSSPLLSAIYMHGRFPILFKNREKDHAKGPSLGRSKKQTIVSQSEYILFVL